ncbi:MAG TPA: hypothetical protein PK510_13970, partial [Ottowia sp.]|nr:hypothetical protein [Ottowia sp.]
MLGVLGGGQLGRMFVHAAQALGYDTVVLDPDPASPAGLVSHHLIQADYRDPDALRLERLADGVLALDELGVVHADAGRPAGAALDEAVLFEPADGLEHGDG